MILVALILSCPTTIIVNRTRDWNQTDRQTLARAKVRCKHLFPEDPCLKKLVKLEELRYHAICGRAK